MVALRNNTTPNQHRHTAGRLIPVSFRGPGTAVGQYQIVLLVMGETYMRCERLAHVVTQQRPNSPTTQSNQGPFDSQVQRSATAPQRCVYTVHYVIHTSFIHQ